MFKYFPRLKALCCISASSWAPLRSPSLLCINLFFDPFSRFTRMVSFPKRYQFHQIGMPSPDSQSRHYRLPLVLPNSRLLSEAPLPPLRVTMTHFTLSSYEGALRLPTFFPILNLIRLGVKPRLCGSSWRAFAFTHPLMLPSTFFREALLACPPFPP